MKKLIISAIALMLLTACPQRPKPVIIVERDEDTTQLRLVSATCYGRAPGTAAPQINYIFTSGTLNIDADGQPSGTGIYVVVESYAQEVDANCYPTAGLYRFADTTAPLTLMTGTCRYTAQGSEPGGCYASMVQEGEPGDWIFFRDGFMIMAGTESNSVLRMKFNDNADNTYNYIYSGPVKVEAGTTADIPAQYSHEPTTPVHITLNGIKAELTPRDARGRFTLDITDADGSHTLCALGYYNNTATPYYGTFTVGSEPTDTAPGRLVYSRGSIDNRTYQTFYAALDQSGNVISAQPIYYITGGRLAIYADAVVGILTTYFGSQITVAYSGPVSIKTTTGSKQAEDLITN